MEEFFRGFEKRAGVDYGIEAYNISAAEMKPILQGDDYDKERDHITNRGDLSRGSKVISHALALEPAASYDDQTAYVGGREAGVTVLNRAEAKVAVKDLRKRLEKRINEKIDWDERRKKAKENEERGPNIKSGYGDGALIGGLTGGVMGYAAGGALGGALGAGIGGLALALSSKAQSNRLRKERAKRYEGGVDRVNRMQGYEADNKKHMKAFLDAADKQIANKKNKSFRFAYG